MPFHIAEGDITLIEADAIVNAANSTLLGGGGVDGAIHRAAGPGLLRECMGLGGCATGDAKITAGYRLPARHVIHTVGPIWHGGRRGEARLLESCYRRSLELARENGCTSVAFPLISAGAYGFPKESARLIAERTIRDFLRSLPGDEEMHVTLVLYSKRDCTLDEGLRNALDAFIASGGTEEYPISGGIGRFAEDFLSGNRGRRSFEDEASDMPGRLEKLIRDLSRKKSMPAMTDKDSAEILESDVEACFSIAPAPSEEDSEEELHACSSISPLYGNEMRKAPCPEPSCGAPQPAGWGSLKDAVGSLDESFSQMLLRKIRESGMSEPECYKKANIDRKLFSKIRSNIHYQPKKATVLAFAIALELSLEETKKLLEKAGFALSHSSKADLIVEFFISKGEWDIYSINDALFYYDQLPLGA